MWFFNDMDHTQDDHLKRINRPMMFFDCSFHDDLGPGADDDDGLMHQVALIVADMGPLIALGGDDLQVLQQLLDMALGLLCTGFQCRNISSPTQVECCMLSK